MQKPYTTWLSKFYDELRKIFIGAVRVDRKDDHARPLKIVFSIQFDQELQKESQQALIKLLNEWARVNDTAVRDRKYSPDRRTLTVVLYLKHRAALEREGRSPFDDDSRGAAYWRRRLELAASRNRKRGAR